MIPELHEYMKLPINKSWEDWKRDNKNKVMSTKITPKSILVDTCYYFFSLNYIRVIINKKL